MKIREIIDPFTGKKVEIINDLVNRLQGRYAVGPTLPDGEPEFGWRQFEGTPQIQLEAASVIKELKEALVTAKSQIITLGGNNSDPDGDVIQRTVLDVIDNALELV